MVSSCAKKEIAKRYLKKQENGDRLTFAKKGINPMCAHKNRVSDSFREKKFSVSNIVTFYKETENREDITNLRYDII